MRGCDGISECGVNCLTHYEQSVFCQFAHRILQRSYSRRRGLPSPNCSCRSVAVVLSCGKTPFCLLCRSASPAAPASHFGIGTMIAGQTLSPLAPSLGRTRRRRRQCRTTNTRRTTDHRVTHSLTYLPPSLLPPEGSRCVSFTPPPRPQISEVEDDFDPHVQTPESHLRAFLPPHTH